MRDINDKLKTCLQFIIFFTICHCALNFVSDAIALEYVKEHGLDAQDLDESRGVSKQEVMDQIRKYGYGGLILAVLCQACCCGICFKITYDMQE
jgi:hypothetical protein